MDLKTLSQDELHILRSCRKKQIRLAGNPADCICKQQMQDNVLAYEAIAKRFLRDKGRSQTLDPTRLKKSLREWFSTYRPNWQLTADDFEKLQAAIRCRFTANAVKTRRKNNLQSKQGSFDF